MKYETNFMDLEDLNELNRYGLAKTTVNKMISDVESFLLERIEGSIIRFVREKKEQKSHQNLHDNYDNLKLTLVAYVMGRYGSISNYRLNKGISYKTKFAQLSVALELLHAFSYEKVSNWFDRAIKNILN